MKKNLRTVMDEFLRNEDAATAIEYGLVAALIAVAIIAGTNTLSKHVNALFICTSSVLELGNDDAWEFCRKVFSN